MPLTEHEMDRIIGALLRAGVILAAIVVLAGGAWHFAQSGAQVPDYRVFRGEPSELRSPAGVLAGVAAGHALSVIQLGVLLLIATPIARVIFSVAAFALQRDRTYVLVTLIVLGALLFSLSGIG